MPTIDDELRTTEAQHQAAARRRDYAHRQAQAILAGVRSAGRSDVTPAEFTQLDRLVGQRDRAARELEGLESQLANLRAAAADELQLQSRQGQTHPTGAAVPGRGRAGLSGGGIRDDDRRGGAGNYWTRASDGRRATLTPGESFADHEIVREHIGRMEARERPILDTHSGLGSLVRSMSTTSGSAIVPTLWASRIIDRARNYAAVLKAGTEIVPMDSKVVQIGRLTTDPTAAFRAEGSTITASDPVFDNVTLTATTLSALTVASIEFMQDAVNADQVAEEAMGKAMGLQLDLACLYGSITTGAEGVNLPSPPNPRGILGNLLANLPANVLGAGTNGTNITAATPWQEILQMIYQVRRGNEVPNALLWPVRLQQGYANRYDTLNQPLRMPDDVANINKIDTNQLASGMTQGTGTNMCDAVCGDFTKALLGQRMEIQLRVLTERYADAGQVGILAMWRGDFQLARPGAFAFYRYLQGA